jgi:hypothetical protein
MSQKTNKQQEQELNSKAEEMAFRDVMEDYSVWENPKQDNPELDVTARFSLLRAREGPSRSNQPRNGC